MFILKRGNAYIAKEIIEFCGLSQEIVQQVGREALLYVLQDNFDQINRVKEIIELNILSPEIIQSSEVQQAGGDFLAKVLINGKIDKAKEIINLNILSPETIQQFGREGLSNVLKFDAVYRAKEIIEFCGLSQEIVQQVGREALLYVLQDNFDQINRVKEIIELNILSPEIIQSSEVQQAGGDFLAKVLINGKIDKAKEIINLNILSPEIIQQVGRERLIETLGQEFLGRGKRVVSISFEEVLKEASIIIDVCHLSSEIIQEAGKQGLVLLLVDGWMDKVQQIIEFCGLSPETIQQAGKEGILRALKDARVDTAKEIIEFYGLSQEIIQSPEVQQAGREGLFFSLQNDWIGRAKEIIEFCGLSQEIIQGVGKSVLIDFLQKSIVDRSKRIIELNILSQEIIQSPEVQQAGREGLFFSLQNDWIGRAKEIIELNILSPEIKNINPSINSFVEKLGLKTWEELLKESEYNLTYLSWLIKNNQECLFNREELNKIDQKVKITYPEAHVAKQSGVDIFAEDAGEDIYKSIKDSEQFSEWQDEQNISGPFQRGAEIFGYVNMFAYCQRKNLSRHDALHQFDRVIAMYNSSGLSKEQFFGSILFQVNKDDASYESGTAHHEFNHVAVNFNFDIIGILAQAEKYAGVEKLQKLAQGLSTPEQVFASWKNLRKYYELCQLLQKTEILDDLQQLRQEGKEKLYQYIETLAFHPNINMQAVLEFWREPGSFLGIDDLHSGSAHQSKKPSNYVEIPNLDLDAEDLRDALVEGRLDELQAFQPFEIEYELPLEETGEQKVEKTIRTILREELGYYDPEQKKRIPGKNEKTKKIFPLIQKLFEENDMDLKEYMRSEEEQELSPEMQAQILQFFGIDNKRRATGRTIKYRAKINAKSDPDGVVAGNDTACCMPFGSGKNNVYTFNPDCSTFTLQQQRLDGTWRTVAQSVLTKDVDIKKNIAEVLLAMQDTNKPAIQDTLPEDVLTQSEFTLACDNVELTPNVKGHELTESQIEMIYRDFMFEYLSRYGKRDSIRQGQVVIGKGYSDSLTHLPEVDNTYAPAAPIAYSDKSHATVYSLVPQRAEGIVKKIIEYNKQQRDSWQSSQPGVSLLTFEDSIRVAYIEGKAYADNKTLMEYLHNMENGLIAKDINNQQKGRPNMSFKYEDKNKRMQGYMFAYEGRVGNEEMIYVADIAVDEKGKGAGLALMTTFLERYKVEYLDKNNPLPIYAQMREQTSYALVKNKLAEFSRLLGVELELEERGTYEQGEDTMHEVVIRVRKSL